MDNTLAIIGDPHIQFNNPSCRQDNYFESIMDKLKQIMKSNSYIIELGDLLSLPVLDIQGTLILVDLLSQYKKQGGRFISLIGNHNIYNWQINTLNKTTTRLLARLNLIDILDADLSEAYSEINLGPFKILPLSLNFSKKELPKAKGQHNILVGHAFYASERDPKHSINYEDIKDLGYEYIFLGHDHEPYKPKIIDNTILYRPGSLGRTTSHTYNLYRKPLYYRINLDSCEIKEVILNSKSSEEIFTYEIINKKQDKTPDYVYDLEALINSYKEKGHSSILSIRKLMEDSSEVTPEIIQFISDIHEACGLEFI